MTLAAPIKITIKTMNGGSDEIYLKPGDKVPPFDLFR